MHGMSGGGAVKRARIEIIPLIDIIFFLLATFIMVSLSMSKNQGVQVALPQAGSAASLGDQEELDKAVTLSVTGKGDVFYNKDKITLAQLPPAYPSAMRGKKLEAVVLVIFIVDAAGKVTNPRIEKSTHTAFDKPALDAVRKWKFEPGLKGGQRVACKMRVPIRFPAS